MRIMSAPKYWSSLTFILSKNQPWRIKSHSACQFNVVTIPYLGVVSIVTTLSACCTGTDMRTAYHDRIQLRLDVVDVPIQDLDY